MYIENPCVYTSMYVLVCMRACFVIIKCARKKKSIHQRKMCIRYGECQKKKALAFMGVDLSWYSFCLSSFFFVFFLLNGYACGVPFHIQHFYPFVYKINYYLHLGFDEKSLTDDKRNLNLVS